MAKYEILEESDIKSVASQLAKAPLEEQQIEIDNIYAQSAVTALKVAIETIEIIKKTSDSTMKSNKQFMALCDKGIDTLNASIADGKVSDEEKKDVREKIMDILKMANESNKTATEISKSGRDKAIKTTAIVGGSLGALAILGIIVNSVAKSIKK